MTIHATIPGLGQTADKAACGATPQQRSGPYWQRWKGIMSTRIEEITCRACLLAKWEQLRANRAETDQRFADRLATLERGEYRKADR